MYRVVLDPGVLIAALISARGAPRALLRAWLEGAFELLVSSNLLAELGGVLGRQKFRAYVSERDARLYVAFLARFATRCPDAASPVRLSLDPDDDYLLALAQSQGADFLVSGDPHLCQLEKGEPPVLTPRAFLNRLE
ncbi:MAG TPA: putative toxin-antitoxin system toxin component, PIN family [Terriglobia bacterium]|nr:putative toxin-antitoxin system toxin component, PIN family [Terriglobia bacterium]